MATPKEVMEQISHVFGDMPLSQKVIGALIMLLTVGGFVAVLLLGNKVDYKVLYSGLTQEDASGVVNRLKEQRIPFQLASDGSTIMVPAAEVYETRLSLAGEGLPRGGGVGFEIFDKTSLGTTDFVQRLNYQRALEGELARTIRQFQQVEAARVHVAAPKDSVFVEDQKPPTASVSVKLRGRNTLSKVQVQSIVNLVASAVPGLTPRNITVVDTSGKLLYRQEETGENGGVAANQLEYQVQVEDVLRKKIESMLEEVVGNNKVSARVTTEIDFKRVNVTEENFDPETKVERSEQLVSERVLAEGEKPAGIPGVKGSLATTTEETGVVAGKNSPYERNNVTRNYEISKMTKQILGTTGGVQRISVAVMVDGTYKEAKDKDGNSIREFQTRTPEEMKRFENLVRKAIGYNEERGDQVEIVSMPFALSAEPEPKVNLIDAWRDTVVRMMMPIAYVLIAILFVFFVVRPFLRLLSTHRPPPPKQVLGAEEPASKTQEEEEELSLRPKAMTDKERIFRLAQSDPDRAADLVRRWLREEFENK